MTDLQRIAHSIDQLRGALGGWDWGSFASTIIATLVGAGAAGVGSWLVLRRERRDRYEESLISGIRRSIDALLAFANAAASMDETGHPSEGVTVTAELMMLESIARGDDAKIVSDVNAQFQEVSKPSNPARDFDATNLVVPLAALAARGRPPQASSKR